MTLDPHMLFKVRILCVLLTVLLAVLAYLYVSDGWAITAACAVYVECFVIWNDR